MAISWALILILMASIFVGLFCVAMGVIAALIGRQRREK